MAVREMTEEPDGRFHGGLGWLLTMAQAVKKFLFDLQLSDGIVSEKNPVFRQGGFLRYQTASVAQLVRTLSIMRVVMSSGPD